VGNIIHGNLSTGTVMIGTETDNGVDKLQVGGSVTASGFKVNAMNAPPTSTTACNTGEIRFSADSIYICIAKNRWRMAPLVDVPRVREPPPGNGPLR
jgi:hypothetical protein